MDALALVVEREGLDDVCVDALLDTRDGACATWGSLVRAVAAALVLDPSEWEAAGDGEVHGCESDAPVDPALRRVELRPRGRAAARLRLRGEYGVDVSALASGRVEDTSAPPRGGIIHRDYAPRVMRAGGWVEATSAAAEHSAAVNRLRAAFESACNPMELERLRDIAELLLEAAVLPLSVFRGLLYHAIASDSHVFFSALVAAGVPLSGPLDAADDADESSLLVAAASMPEREHLALAVLAADSDTVHSANAAGETPLLAAARGAHEALCVACLDAGADASAAARGDRYTALLWAVRHPLKEDLCLRLVAAGGAASHAGGDGYTPLIWAARNGRERTCLALLLQGANVAAATQAGDTALLWAASEGHARVCAHLIDHGADVQAASRNGFTPLIWAARVGMGDVCERLIAAGARANATTNVQDTALLWASCEGHDDVCDILLAADADPNHASLHGATPLTWAAQKGFHAICSTLLAAGANVNHRTASGYTALHYAARLGCPELCASLLDAGADCTVASHSGVTPPDVADDAGHGALRALFGVQ
eukprot:TRINITY_DN2154_c0_g1_i1.p1 TRINITY_DN2154_c0_g1~~TRINITY_DN2154_c0_g1_i1.p1  ORF type:complete len:543 (+),score=90.33 TRINITY_DN2154_c0_g1_i1:682-2310(+)